MAGAAAAASQSRLDRLVTLLDSGSTPSIRATAARQLGQIAALRVRGSNTGGRGGESGCGSSRRRNGEAPAGSPVILKEEAREYLDDQSSVDGNDKASTSREADRVAGTGGSISMYRGVDGDWEQAVFLIARVLPHLRSKTWDTRIAAGQAIEAIAAACGIWDPDVDVGVGVLNTHASHSSGNTEQATDLLTFATFSLPQVLATGKKLLSSAGNEYDQPIFASVEERLAHAKKDMQRLGLGSMAGEEVDFGVDVEKELMAEVKNESPKSAKILKLPPPRFAATSGGIAALPPPQYSPSITTMPSPLGAPMAKNEKPSETVSTPRVALPSSSSTEEIDASKLSARERNQLKRKRKMEDKAMANGSAGAAGDASMAAKTRVMEQSPVSSPNNDLKFKVPANLAVHTTNDNDLASSPSPIPATPRTPAGSHVPSDSLDIKTASNEVLATPNTPQGIADLTAGGRATAATATSLVPLPHQWPFTLVCSLLLADLFSPKWEVRHGAALGLRELFKTQGYGGGRLQGGPKVAKENCEIKQEDQDFSSTDVEDNELRHLRWCEDASIRLLCVLSLDRLGDFVFDHVIAPVRETAGQTMASLLRWMPDALIWKVHSVLLDMVRQEYLVKAANGDVPPTDGLQAKRSVPGYVWEVRHAGLLGLKYEVTIREDLLLKDGEASPMLTSVVDLSILCLHDDDDDVRGVAAATLLPVVHQLVEYMPHAISSLMEQLWACLSNLKDDLSSSTSGVMDLLAKMVESPKVIPHLLDHSLTSIPTLIPRLFPFFRHTITSVRLAVLNALRAFLDIPHLSKGWIDDRLVRLLFQNLIVEERESIREASRTTWHRVLDILGEDESRLVSITKPHLETFFTILMTQLGAPIDFSLFYVMPSGLASRDAYNVDKGVLTQDLTLVGVDTVIRGRLGAAQGLGSIMAHWPMAHDTSFFEQAITHYLSRTSALQKCLAAVVVQEWAYAASAAKEETPLNSTIVDAISARLISILDSPAPATYSEMGVMLQRIQSQCHGVYNFFIKEAKVPKAKVPSLPTAIDTLGQSSAAFTIDSAKNVMSTGYDGLLQLVAAKNRKLVLPGLEERRRKLIADVGFYQTVKEKQDTQVGATVAGAAIALQRMPAKLNPVIRSIMNSVKFEENLDLQQRSARAVADFIAMCSLPSAKANPSEKIIRNLCAFVCQDTTQTAIFDTQQAGIRSMNETPAARSSSGKVGRPAADKGEMAMTEEVRQSKLIRRGAELALQAVADKFKENLFSTVPSMWACMAGPLVGLSKLTEEEQEASQASTGQSIIDCCTLVEVNVKNLHGSLKGQALELIDPHIRAIASPFSVIRGAAAKSLAAMADCFTEEVMLTVVEKVVPLLGAATSVARRQGAIETLSQIVATLELKLLPYVIVLVVPVLGRMSDPDDSIRLVATNTFASLVKMVPLEAGLPDPPGFSQELLDRREGEREFLAQLLDGNKVEKYEIPVKINAQLRKYQQDGVNWMTFLAKFQLHGILCDDMGLGKTLQSICILASRHYEYEQSRKSDVEGKPHLSSLIVCPPTLTGHWCHEIKQYSNNLQPLLYAGQPQERLRLQSRIAAHDCIVMSYDTLRNDIGFLSQLDWFYCILDEGHIIKSGKAKTTKAVKMIKSVHRLILSGTPIQNNVLELWSLFDFLMPGFLGNEKAFMERYGRPILASKDAKVTAREHERASLALEALHKQVLPFLLRRMKEDVLDDLPPKIIQDISCDLGEVQKQLYEEYIREQDPDALQEALVADEIVQGAGEDKKQHVFQTLQYLRKLVCHPLLVFDRNKPKHRQIEEALQKKGGQLRNIDNAPKLLALKQLLNDCGIGVQGQNNGTDSSLLDPEEDAGVSQHRVLVFCQQRQMLDLIEKDLFQQVMPSVSYMRLDGSVSSDRRFAMVQRFNSDPSLDVLLLTTSVGGLGLTLTGADTVIFVEHDWNPMKDLQAMDRAHRLGQKKVVNVYRLITKNTLEEKIMGLQRFKINVAGSIVNQENKTMDSMETDQLLDLFDVDGQDAAPEWTKKGEAAANQDKKTKGVSQKVLLANIEAMQDTGDDYNDLKDWKG